MLKMRAPIWVLACVMALGFAGGHGGGDSNTVPALPVVEQQQNQHKESCPLDLSDELFGGVEEACGEGRTLERSRCCPVLAAWLYAAHARTALQPSAAPPLSSPAADQMMPVLPDDSQACVNSLQSSLAARGIHIPRPNATCDAILCFCGIRLHQLTSLTCPTAFNVSSPGSLQHRNASAPTSAVRALASNCTDPSFQGCTQCLRALDKLKGRQGRNGGISERTSRMYNRDCELMGLTWLLAKNKTAYIPTVSAVLRAVMYTDHPLRESQCSPDQENMPLAVDSDELQQSAATTPTMPLLLPLLPLLLMLLPGLKGF
ncbi:hypothetical protein SUGI_0655020 [Cryptomeria japonica]|uniref:uncharacterized GPI-anchored protein At4g28100 n=1 Tax=Cryptomeria japonica TaxID=3369 RepID=UPI002414C2E2|nr:uncharacterized GPI-anchored protein At4g28100 [Cryptomeria japonica]GLJ32567.1 hypothetical protein SUGI_0655020 [Cryptomeria japonica]